MSSNAHLRCSCLPLHTVALAGSAACVQELLAAGADVDALDKLGSTALAVAAWEVRLQAPAADPAAATVAAAELGMALLQPAAGGDSAGGGSSGGWDWSEPLPPAAAATTAAATAAAAPTPPRPAVPASTRSSIDSPGTFARGLREEVMCPITQEPNTDPVTAADGQVYERAAIKGGRALGARMCLTDMRCFFDSCLIGGRLKHVPHTCSACT